MKTVKAILVLILAISLQGCVTASYRDNLDAKTYDPKTDPYKAIIFGELRLEPNYSSTRRLYLHFKNLDTNKDFEITRGGYFAPRDPFFVIKVDPGKYSITSMGGQFWSALWNSNLESENFTFEIPAEHTAVNIGIIGIKSVRATYCGLVGSLASGADLFTEDYYDETEKRFNSEYSDLGFKIIRANFPARDKTIQAR